MAQEDTWLVMTGQRTPPAVNTVTVQNDLGANLN